MVYRALFWPGCMYVVQSHKGLREITGVTVDTFKKHLDEWLMREVPDQPKCDGYAGKVAATSNSIFHQYSPNKRVSNRR